MQPEQKIYVAEHVFNGETILNHQAVFVEDGIIKNIVAASTVHSENVTDLGNVMLAPAFIDLQIYGAYNRLFSVFTDVDALQKLKDYCEEGGAAFFLPTISTNTKEVMYNAIDAIKNYWQQSGIGVLGLHLEGPWLNKEKRGAHKEEYIHVPTMAEVEDLLNYGHNVIRMITLAPEIIPFEIIDLIQSRGIIVSAGHSNATYEQANDAFRSGIDVVTHLFNAMSPMQHRSPGLAGAVLDHTNVMSSVVPDGVHVQYPVLRVAKRAMQERLFAITDAVTECTEGPYQHQLKDDHYINKGTLSGSSLTMQKALINLIHHVKITAPEALRMCSLYPAKVLKLDHQLGRIKEGYESKFVVLDKNLDVVKVIRD